MSLNSTVDVLSFDNGLLKNVVINAYIQHCLQRAYHILIIDQFYKSHDASVPYLTMHHSEQKYAHFCSDWFIVGHETDALWDLWMRSIALPWRVCPRQEPQSLNWLGVAPVSPKYSQQIGRGSVSKLRPPICRREYIWNWSYIFLTHEYFVSGSVTHFICALSFYLWYSPFT